MDSATYKNSYFRTQDCMVLKDQIPIYSRRTLTEQGGGEGRVGLLIKAWSPDPTIHKELSFANKVQTLCKQYGLHFFTDSALATNSEIIHNGHQQFKIQDHQAKFSGLIQLTGPGLCSKQSKGDRKTRTGQEHMVIWSS